MAENLHINRQFKDRLFRLLFGSEEYKENILSLYNALNNTSYTDVNDIELTTIDDIIYIRMKNDVSLLLHDTMNLWEQQSSYNPNMPVRGLMYFGNLYEAYISKSKHGIYSSKLIPLPTPRYVVLYNGTQDQSAVTKLKLSDAFMVKDEEAVGDFEWTATMVNINRGHNEELLRKCPALMEYMTLIELIRDFRSKGYSVDQAVDEAVKKCIEDGILAEFLTKHRAEVKDVCMTEFDEKAFIACMKEEGRNEGEAIGREKKGRETALAMLKDKMAEALVAKYSGLSPEEVHALAAML